MAQLRVKQWLERIADEKIRESALRQMDGLCDNDLVSSIGLAIYIFSNWDRTEEGFDYWHEIYNTPPALLPLNETKTDNDKN